MGQTASHLANRKVLPGAVPSGRLLLAEGVRDKEEADYLIFCRGREGVYEADYLTLANQEIPA